MLFCAGNSISDVGFARLKVVLSGPHSPQLHTLKLSGNSGRITTVELFELLDQRANLLLLEVSENGVDLLDSELSNILVRSSVSMLYLRVLDMSFNPLGDAGMVKLLKAICPVTHAHRETSLKLEKLLLQSSEIGNGTMYYLSTMFQQRKLPNLDTLSIGMNLIGAGGIEALLQGIGTDPQYAPSLTTLLVPLNNIGNDGLLMFVGRIVAGAFENLEVLIYLFIHSFIRLLLTRFYSDDGMC